MQRKDNRHIPQELKEPETIRNRERCCTLVNENLSNILLSTLKCLHLDVNKLITQTYDGAASMSGCNRGVQAVIRQVAPQAHYIHCRAHRCNLVIGQSTKFGRNFFGVLQQLFVVIEGSSKCHNWFMEAQKAAGLHRE